MPSSSVTITRPNNTTAYTAVDVVGPAVAALEFSKVGSPDGEDLIITQASLRINDDALIASEAGYKLHLYNVTPPSALADNAPWDVPSGDRASYLGSIDLTTPVDIGSTLYVEVQPNKQIRTLSGSLFAYLSTTAAHTPEAERVYVVTIQTKKAA